MEPYTLMTMAEMRRRELNADARQRRGAVRVRRAARMRDPLNTLTLAAAGGLTSTQIGAALGIPPGTVRYRLSVARRALAEALGDYDDPKEAR